MITTDPVRRAAIFSEVRDILARESSAEDRELLLSFATVAYAEMPDALALKLEPSVLAQRLLDSFRFVVRTVPPAVQLYKGLPGLHVVVQNPQDAAEATIVETHTLDAPFIFESLKNYFQKEGLRVFSAVHPIFTVRRQWERIVSISSAGEDGSRELYCQFRIERVDARDRPGPTVQLLGAQPDEVVRDHMERCRAFVFAAEEDFGVAVVEAQAAGAPVIAYDRGGVAETVLAGETGVFFSEQTPESLMNAVNVFEATAHRFSATRIRAHAERFGRERFQREFAALLQRERARFDERGRDVLPIRPAALTGT